MTQIGFMRHHHPDGLGQVLESAIFEHVTGRPGLEHIQNKTSIVMHGEGDDLDPGQFGDNLPGGLDAV